MPPRKKADRARLRAEGSDGAGGLVRGRGRPLPDRAASGCQLAAGGPPRHPLARVRARRDGQDPALFHPATGRVSLRPATSGTSTVLHGWLKEVLGQIGAALPARAAPLDPAANRALWQAWQDGLAVRFSLPADLPPLRILLVWDNLAGHKTPEMVLWLCRHGIMPLYTPLGGSWLNMAESIQ